MLTIYFLKSCRYTSSLILDLNTIEKDASFGFVCGRHQLCACYLTDIFSGSRCSSTVGTTGNFLVVWEHLIVTAIWCLKMLEKCGLRFVCSWLNQLFGTMCIVSWICILRQKAPVTKIVYIILQVPKGNVSWIWNLYKKTPLNKVVYVYSSGAQDWKRKKESCCC